MALPRTVTRTLVSLSAVVGLGAAFVAGTSYGGSDRAGSVAPGRRGHGRLARRRTPAAT